MKKKLVSLILAAVMLGTLIGCGSDPAGTGTFARECLSWLTCLTGSSLWFMRW